MSVTAESPGATVLAAPDPTESPRPTALGVWLILAGVVGWIAAFSLTLERFALLENPGSSASCDFSLLVQCTVNLESPQGSVFGFPNPLIGLGGWVAVLVVGVALLAGARFPRWFWLVFWAGIAFAFGFTIWLIAQSIFVLTTLCPWCMVTWLVTIPTFYAVTLQLFRNGTVPVRESTRARAARLGVWVPLAAILSYAVVIAIAQVQLDAIPNIIQTLQRLWA